MKERVDKLFNNKLQDIEVHPSPVAWTQIENVLTKENEKKKVRTWYYVAAAVAMIAVSSGIWVVSMNTTAEVTSPSLAQVVPSQVQEVPESNPNVSSVVEEVSSPVQQHVVAVTVQEETVEDEEIPQETLLIPDPVLSLSTRSPHLTAHKATLQLDFYPMYVEDTYVDESKLEKAWQYAKRLKNGEEQLLNLRKAKHDLFAFAKSKIKPEDNSQLNLD